MDPRKKRVKKAAEEVAPVTEEIPSPHEELETAFEEWDMSRMPGS